MERQLPDGAWIPAYNLSYPLDEPGSRPGWGLFGTKSIIPLIGFVGAKWRTLRVPPVAVPGSYRIAKEVGDTTYYVTLAVMWRRTAQSPGRIVNGFPPGPRSTRKWRWSSVRTRRVRCRWARTTIEASARPISKSS
jgi:hypothetical protein